MTSLEVALTDDLVLDDFELLEEGKGYREWCVPAGLLNGPGKVRALAEADDEQIWRSRQRRYATRSPCASVPRTRPPHRRGPPLRGRSLHDVDDLQRVF